MQQKDIDRPLSASELQRLKSFINESPDAMGFDKATGFIAAICSAPTNFMPSDWITMVIGEQEYETEEEAQEIYGLIIRIFNQINIALNEGLRASPPVSFSEAELDQWCIGYMEVVRMDPIWANDGVAFEALVPMGVLSGEFKIEGQEDDQGNIIEDDSNHRTRYRRALRDRVAEIHQYWTQWRRKKVTSPKPISPPKIQRNVSCPCGSGAKYKRCCGR